MLRPTSVSDQCNSVAGHRILLYRCHQSDVGAYVCTIVVLKWTALRRMAMSLLELGTDFLVGNMVFVWLLWSSAVRVHDSQAYRKMDVTRERISRILELRVS